MNIDSLYPKVGIVRPIVDPALPFLCTKPYKDHPRGCPNYGKKPICPPQAPALGAVFDLTHIVYAVVNRFSLADHAIKMKQRHPNWTERQCRNLLYWQGTARKQLKEGIKWAQGRSRTPLLPLLIPEATGVNVTRTVAQMNITISWPPIYFAYQVALLGTANKTLKALYPAFAQIIATL